MKDSWICRDYGSGDEQRILRLFARVFQQEMSLGFWRWRFINNPFGEAIIKLLFNGEDLIGHYSVIPMVLQVQGDLRSAVLSMTTMTHPDYRGQGIFTYLAEETYKRCREKGFSCVYGFPNKTSHPGFVQKLNWKDLGKMTVLEKHLQRPAETRPEGTRLSIKEVSRFDRGVDSLWDRVKHSCIVVVPRTAAFLNWRFADNPATDYVKCVASDSSSAVLGYAVLKTYTVGELTRGHIVDMLGTSDEDVLRLVLEYSYNCLLRRGIQNVSCWMPDESSCCSFFEKEGFVRSETETYFGVRSLSDEGLVRRRIEQFSSWHLTMADSDVF